MKNVLLVVTFAFLWSLNSEAQLLQTREQAQVMMDSAAADFAKAQTAHSRETALLEQLSQIAREKAKAEEDFVAEMATMAQNNSSAQQLLNATKRMQATQMKFNLRYLKIESQARHERRSYTSISNIMKTKHDTVKNSISNIR